MLSSMSAEQAIKIAKTEGSRPTTIQQAINIAKIEGALRAKADEAGRGGWRRRVTEGGGEGKEETAKHGSLVSTKYTATFC